MASSLPRLRAGHDLGWQPTGETGEERPWRDDGAGRRFSELAARTVRGGGARGAPKCGKPDLRCGEVRDSPETLVRVDAVGAEGCTGEGPLCGLWQPASGSWRMSSSA
jgi:hypothetical protein